MFETPDELMWLQEIIDSSIDGAGPFLRSSFEMPDRSLSATETVERLEGVVDAALATVTAKGEPRVAPIGGILVHGRFHFPTVGEAARVRHIERNPAISVTAFEDVSFAVIVHGRARLLGEDDAGYEQAEDCYRRLTGTSIADWGATPIFIVIDPDRVFTFDRDKGSASATRRPGT